MHESVRSGSTRDVRAPRGALSASLIALRGAFFVLICALGAPEASDPLPIAAAHQVHPEAIVRAITSLQSVPGRSRVTGTPGAAAARAWLTDRLRAYGLTPEPWPFTTTNPFDEGRPIRAVNLVARLGPARGEALVLIAHLDTKAAEDAEDAAARGWRWAEDAAPGGDDDASGAAALLEVARGLAPRAEALGRPVVLAWTDAEELAKIAGDGFMEDYGASALAEALAARGTPVAAALAVDMLARPRPYGYWLRLYSDGRWASTHLALTVELAAGAVAPEAIVEHRVAPGFTYSDHGAFWALGQGGLLLIEDDFHHPRYHTAQDVFRPEDDFYDIGQVVAGARILVATALTY